MSHLKHYGLLISSMISLWGCATSPSTPSQGNECRDLFEQADTLTKRTGSQDAGAHRLAGLPYLRSNRFLASFSSEVDEPEALVTWVEHLRALDMDKRSRELARAGMDDDMRVALLGKLDHCGRKLSQLDMAVPAWREHLKQSVEVPHDYSLLARSFGLYPLAVPFLNMGISGFHDEVREDYAQPLNQLDNPGQLLQWLPATANVTIESVDFDRDALGIPQISDSQWQMLANAYAPGFWVEVASENDVIGEVAWGQPPRVKPDQPVVYFRSAMTRFQDQILPQLVYVAWFNARTPESNLDIYAGPLDGLIWRVTLDESGQPLIYDTIHPCGCFHYYFPVADLKLRENGSFWQEPVLVPQATTPEGPVSLRLQAGRHYLRRVVAQNEVLADRHILYQLKPYSDLERLPAPDSSIPKSLYDAKSGIVAGTERLERFLLWPSGVASPGAMRQWGRHATSFVGQGHFDDARLLESLFEWTQLESPTH